MSTYNVTARRWARGWELHITDSHGEEVGVTQSRNLGGAERMVRDYLELDDRTDVDEVVIVPELDDAGLGKRAAEAREAVRAAEKAQRTAAAASRAVARELAAAGLTGADSAAVLGVSAQRVSQLLAKKGPAEKVVAKKVRESKVAVGQARSRMARS